MLDFLQDKSEKKVEYIELIYDLIFVYLVSRNGSLLHNIQDGFLTPMVYMTYIASSLAILQIWYFSTLFINRYGTDQMRVPLWIFFNMYLLYYMANGIRANWGAYYYQYNLAWALILLNLALQYFLQLRKAGPCSPRERRYMRYQMFLLVIEAAIVLVTIPIYLTTGLAFGPWALVFGIGATLWARRTDVLLPVDFPHLSERVMLYVVFTFGEMILGLTGYFSGGFDLSSGYFSLMAFLIVAGLFSGYGYYYNHLLDHEAKTSGAGYMLLHIVMILALNNITAALEFMREPTVHALPKTVMLVGSMLLYFLCLLLTQRYAVKHVVRSRFYWTLVLCCLCYCGLSAVFFQQPYGSIAVSAAFVLLQLVALRRGSVSKAPGTAIEI